MKLTIQLLLAFAPSLVLAQASGGNHGPTIFDVRRSLPLEPDQPAFHDFYIDAGPEAGFRKGQYVTVVRPLMIQNPALNKQQATLDVTVGYLQVVQVQRGITVARLFGELTDEERPALEYESVMIGDRIDLGSLTTKAPKVNEREKPKPKPKELKLFGPQGAAAQGHAAAAMTVLASSAAGLPAVADAAISKATSTAPLAGAASSAGATGPAVPQANEIATTSDSRKKTSPPASSPDMVRIPVPASHDFAQDEIKKNSPPKEL